jgi:hypothetical protein
VAEKGAGARRGNGQRTRAEPRGQPDSKPALERIAQQGQDGGGLVAAAQHIGGAGVAGTVAARIGEAEGFDDGEESSRAVSDQTESRACCNVFIRVRLNPRF